MADITFNGMTMEYSVVEGMMDEGVKTEIELNLKDFSEQDFLDAYIKAHKEKLGTDFLQG